MIVLCMIIYECMCVYASDQVTISSNWLEVQLDPSIIRAAVLALFGFVEVRMTNLPHFYVMWSRDRCTAMHSGHGTV